MEQQAGVALKFRQLTQTMNTINTIELSSICNMSCRYCINRLMVPAGRIPEIMSDEVFDASIAVLRELVIRGTQKEVNINGNGESTLDPQLISRARQIMDIVGEGRQVSFCTNGLTMTYDFAVSLRDAGIKRVDVSAHSAVHARQAVDIMRRVGLDGQLAIGAITSPHNWAGQIPDEYQVSYLPKMICHPLIEGRGYVQSNGSVSPCCYDYRGLGSFGRITDADILEKKVSRYSLCDTCHQVIPEGIGE